MSKLKTTEKISCRCIVCDKASFKNDMISMHRFPIDPEIRRIWMEACGIDSAVNVMSRSVCSQHFTPDCYVQSEKSKNCFLKKEAVPNRNLNTIHYNSDEDSSNITFLNKSTSTVNEYTMSPSECRKNSSELNYVFEINNHTYASENLCDTRRLNKSTSTVNEHITSPIECKKNSNESKYVFQIKNHIYIGEDFSGIRHLNNSTSTVDIRTMNPSECEKDSNESVDHVFKNNDHTYSVRSQKKAKTPANLGTPDLVLTQRENYRLKLKTMEQKKKIRVLNQHTLRLRKKINNLKALIVRLKKK